MSVVTCYHRGERRGWRTASKAYCIQHQTGTIHDGRGRRRRGGKGLRLVGFIEGICGGGGCGGCCDG